ncbi:MAG: serine hydrolase [Elusimicrobia bacterium]|nr:serine hydrolase [Elusimicrobiota bacterium]
MTTLLALAAAAWALSRLRRIAAVGASYKAKALASALFVSRLDLDPERADEVSAEAYAILRLFRARVDRANQSVSASFLGLQRRTASVRSGFGATLAGAPRPQEEPAPRSPSPELLVQPLACLTPLLDAAFADNDPRRLRRTRAIVVLSGGKVVAERYAPGITAQTPLNGWSMTKSVMGALIGTIVGQKRLSLGDRGLLPQWSDGRAEIALEDLLRMRSGLRFSEVYSNPLSDVTRMLFDSTDAAGFAASRPLAAPPGTVWQYSSGTTNILSLIARRAVGETEYPAWPRRALFDPLGMSSAVFERDAAGTFVASSFLFATARDWARFGQLHVEDGIHEGRRLLPEGWVRFGAAPTPQAPQARYGAHWWLKLSPELGGQTPAAARVPADAFHALGHEGQCLTVIPSRRLVVVRLGLSIDITAWDHASFLAGLLDTLPV